MSSALELSHAPADAAILPSTISARYSHVFGGEYSDESPVAVCVGVGLGWYQTSIDGMSNEDAPGAYVKRRFDES